MINKKIDMPYYGLKKAMDLRGYSQEKLAKVVGMPYTTFNVKLNRHNGRDFKISEAQKIAEVLLINISDFF